MVNPAAVSLASCTDHQLGEWRVSLSHTPDDVESDVEDAVEDDAADKYDNYDDYHDDSDELSLEVGDRLLLLDNTGSLFFLLFFLSSSESRFWVGKLFRWGNLQIGMAGGSAAMS